MVDRELIYHENFFNIALKTAKSNEFQKKKKTSKKSFKRQEELRIGKLVLTDSKAESALREMTDSRAVILNVHTGTGGSRVMPDAPRISG